MTLTRLAWRGLTFHWRHHLAVLAGVCASSTVLIGALVVGDSVRASLLGLALTRLGAVEYAIETGEYRVRAELAGRLERSLGRPVAPVLRLAGTATSDSGHLSVSRVQVLGVDERFWQLGGTAPPASHVHAATLVNRRLAALLNLRPGDELVLRADARQALPGDLAMAWSEPASRPMRVSVDAVIGDAQLGRFALEADQTSPATIFIPRARLAGLLGHDDRANLLLIASGSSAPLPSDDVSGAIRSGLELDDVGLQVEETPTGGCQLVSNRFFLPRPAAQAALEARAGASGVLTYFVNHVSTDRGRASYAFVSAAAASASARAVRDDEIVLSDWLAHDAHAAVGDTVEIEYFAPDSPGKLEEATARLRVAGVVSTAAMADATLVPTLPGLTEADSCHSWDPSFPIDLSSVTSRDEAYWRLYRAAPKAFVTLATAQRLWGNRHGDLTAVRFTRSAGNAAAVARSIRDRLDPAALGWRVRAVREEGLSAAAGGLDLGGLFLGLSVFLIAAALLFAALFQALSVARRAGEAHTLAMLGLSLAQIRTVALLETVPIALLGTALGAPCAWAYAALVLNAVPLLQGSATTGVALILAIGPRTLALGVITHSAASLAILVLTSRRLGAQRAVPRRAPVSRQRLTFLAAAALVGLTLAAGVGFFANPGGRRSVAATWTAGALALAASLAGMAGGMSALAAGRINSLASVGLRSVGHHLRRSLTIAGALAAAVFVVTLVALHNGAESVAKPARSSGTGGFALLAETALALRYDLNEGAARRALGLPDSLPATFVSLRSREGDDASCRNLNRAVNPRLLGVPAADLAARGAFSFAGQMSGLSGEPSWRLLELELGDGTVPAVADANTILWGLGKQLGDVITTVDGRGQPLRLRLVGSLKGSVLQGSVIVSEQHFLRSFPANAGYGALLIDTEPNAADPVAEALSQALRDHGLDLRPTAVRLAELRSAEDTYIAIFLALGVLGLTLATAGCAAIVGRDVIERSREIAFLQAVGFSGTRIARMLLAEHGLLLVGGVAAGLLAAGLAFVPGATHWPGALALGAVAVTVLAVPVSGVCATMLACRVFLGRDLASELRCE